MVLKPSLLGERKAIAKTSPLDPVTCRGPRTTHSAAMQFLMYNSCDLLLLSKFNILQVLLCTFTFILKNTF